MISGHAAMRDSWHVDDAPAWHLVDLAGWPLLSRCGLPMPDPMRRQVRALRSVAVDDACPRCLAAAAAGGAGDVQQLRGVS